MAQLPDVLPKGVGIDEVHPPPAPGFLGDQTGLGQLFHVIGHPGLNHPQILHQLTVAESRAAVFLTGEVAATPLALGQHPHYSVAHGVAEGFGDFDQINHGYNISNNFDICKHNIFDDYNKNTGNEIQAR